MADPRQDKVLQGRYRLEKLLAEGGMGVVYKAERLGIGRPVVVKFLHSVLTDKPGIVDRFEREARATARLNHPNCVAMVDFGLDEGAPYLVMEYVEGRTLADVLDGGAVKAERAIEITRQILAGLEHAHTRGILHRDLKPANVMIVETEGYGSDFVKILDFGLAKLAWPGEDKRDVTVEGIAIGTPGYMSPEQAAGIPSDRRSDIYCTGALLYHLVTGAKAFDGDDVREILRRHREETPASPRALKAAAGISQKLEDVIERAMQRDPTKRYQSATEMVRGLAETPEAKRATISIASTMAAPTPPPDDATRAEAPSARAKVRPRRVRGWFLAGGVLGAGGALAAVVYSPLGALVRPADDVVLTAPRLVDARAPGRALPSPTPAPHGPPPASPRPSLPPPATPSAATAAPAATTSAPTAASPPAPTTPTVTPAAAPPATAPVPIAPPGPATAAPATGTNGATPTSMASAGSPTPPPSGLVPAHTGEGATHAAPPHPGEGATHPAPPSAGATPPVAEPATPPAGDAETHAPPPAHAGEGAEAAAGADDDVDPKADDGSAEDDHATPPEPPTAPRREAPPQVRTLADVRGLIRKGDSDGALAGLYRLRRAKPAPLQSAQIATLIGNLYFDRKWWTDALREYRFAITLSARSRLDDTLINNSVRALSDGGTYARARRLLLEYVGRGAAPALRRTAKSAPTPVWRKRAQLVLAALETKAPVKRR